MVGLVLLSAAQTAPSFDPSSIGWAWPLLWRLGAFVGGVSVVIAIGWVILEPALTRVVRRRNRKNETIQEAIRRYVRLVVLVLALLVGMTVAGYGHVFGNSALIVAAVTLAIGVAAQSVVGSLVSGLVLVADPQFNVGDFIEWEGGEGTVRSITLRVTRVETPADELVTLPNRLLTSTAVTRPYSRGRYRITESVAIPYDVDVDLALDALETAAADTIGIRTKPEPTGALSEFAGDAVVVSIHCWVEDPKRRDVVAVRSALATNVKLALDDATVPIAPPAKRDLEGSLTVTEE